MNDSADTSLLGVGETENTIGDGEKSDIVVNIPETIYLPVGYYDAMEPSHRYSVNHGSVDPYSINLAMSDNFGNYGMVDWWYDGSSIYLYVGSPIQPGSYELSMTYDGDDNYNPLDLHIPILVFPFDTSVSANDDSITVAVDGSESAVTGNVSVIINGDDKGNFELDSNKQSLTISDLSAGTYDVIVNYTNGNYDDMIYKTTVIIYNASQWALPGLDVKNSGNSAHTRFNNSYVLWNASVNNPISSALVDSEGKVYIVDNSNVTIFYENGTLKTTRDGGSRGAISLIDNHIILYVRPWSNIAAFDINTLAGVGTRDSQVQFYTNSRYSPVKGPDGRIYVSFYADNGGQPNGGKYISIVKYDSSSNQIVWDKAIVNSQPISSPVFDDDGKMYVNTVSGIRIVDLSSDSVISSIPDVGIVGRPVIDDNNIVYAFGKDNQIHALNWEGIVWNITVDEGIGSAMAIDNQKGLLYSVDNAGNLYSYNTEENGAGSEIYNIGANATAIMVDGNSIVYVGDSNGNVWAFDSEGNLLWNIGLGSPVVAQMAMGANGAIYVVTAETIYALGYKNDTDLDVNLTEKQTTFDEINVTATVDVNATGSIYFTLDYGEAILTTIENGEAILSLGKLTFGNHTLVVYYEGDANYSDTSKTVEFEINKVETTIDADVNESTVSVTLPAGASGNIYLNVNGTGYYAELNEDGNAVFNIKGLEPGKEYDATVIYPGDENCTGASEDIKINIPAEPEPQNPNLLASSVNGTVTATVNSNATGIITVTVDGTTYASIINNGKVEITVLGLENAKSYTATVNYLGDNNFTGATITTTVKKEDSIIPALTVKTTNNAVDVTLPTDATGYVIVSVDGTAYYAPVNNGKSYITAKGLDAGNYTADVTYFGDNKYNKESTTTTISIPKNEPLTPTMDVKATNTTLDITLPSSATGYVLVDVENTHLFSLLNNGKATLTVSGLDSGKTYNAIVTYMGDDNYQSTTKTVTITIPKDAELITPTMDVNITDEVINVNMPTNVTGFILANVDNEGYYAPLSNGKATIKLHDLSAGNHTAEITYTGDRKYKQVNETQVFNVERALGTIISEDFVKIEKNASRYEAQFTDIKGNTLANKTVKFIINGNTYARTTNDAGKAGLNINLVAGTYSVIINNTVTGEVKVNTITVQSRFSDNPDLEKYYKNASRFVVRALDDEGNPVKAGESVRFNINGVFYNRTTNATGHASIAINLQPGEYIVTSEYRNCVASNKIIVKSVLSAEDLTKQFGVRKAFTAKLVDGTGKALADTPVTFNINGVLYSRTTNAEGIASLNINLQAGEYIITTSYNGANIANKVTVTA